MNRSAYDRPKMLSRSRKSLCGSSLMEAIMAVLVGGLLIAAVVTAFMTSNFRAESSTYAVAAQALAMQGYEQVRASKWDRVNYPPMDQCLQTNFPPRIYILDVASKGTNVVYATNFTTITQISTNPELKMVRVDCVYTFLNQGLRTNTIASFRAPESGQQNSSEIVASALTPPPSSGTTSVPNSRGKRRSERNPSD